MFINIWNYLKGYVIIEISGFSIERFLNLAMNKNIKFENFKNNKNNINCKVSISDFKKLKPCAKKTKSKIKIIKKHGLPFFTFKNRKRKFFAFGIFVFIFMLYFLSSFIWSIQIIGNEQIDNNQILKFLAQNNFYIGTYKKNIKIKEIEKNIKNNFDEISWVSIQIKGTNAIIKISEAIKKLENIENDEPCNIIANNNGIIIDIVTRSGTPLVKEKDIFKAGDILVSSEILLKEGEDIKGSKFVHADADIKAKRWHNFVFEVPFNYYVKQYTGKSKKTFSLIAFNKNLSLNLIKPKINFKNYDKFTTRKQLKLSENFYLPFILIKTEFKEYIPKQKKYSLNEAKLYAEKIIINKIIQEFDISTDIIEKNVVFEELKNKIIVKVYLTISENIVTKQKITPEQIERNTIQDETEKNSTS